MVYVGICDDLIEHRQMLKNVCERYFSERRLKYKIVLFRSGEEMLRYSGERLMLLLLDIEMKGITGIDVMHRLLHSDKIWRILFVSSHDELMIQTFGLKTLGFCSKPIRYEDISRWLDVAIEESDCNKIIRFEDNTLINVDEIIYIESDGHYIRVHTVNENPLFVMDIFEASELLVNTSVARIHKSYMVNLAYIDQLTARYVKLQENYSLLPIGRSYKDDIKQRYQTYIYEIAKRRSKL